MLIRLNDSPTRMAIQRAEAEAAEAGLRLTGSGAWWKVTGFTSGDEDAGWHAVKILATLVFAEVEFPDSPARAEEG